MIAGSCNCGAVHWRFEAEPDAATICNCSSCRRYGALWIYGWHDEDVFVTGPTHRYLRGKKVLGFHFCGECGCLAYWLAAEKGPDGRRRMAVNIRLAERDAVADLPVQRFDGLHSYEDLPLDGRRVADLWF